MGAALLTAGSGNAFANDTNISSAVPSSAFRLRFPAFLTSPAQPVLFARRAIRTVPDAARLTRSPPDRFALPIDTVFTSERSSPVYLVNEIPLRMNHSDDSTDSPVHAIGESPHSGTALDRAPISALDSTEDAPHPSLLGHFAQRAGNVANDVVESSLSMIGVRYRWGGTTPSHGLDCSGFVRYVFQDTLGLQLPRRAEDMAHTGQKVMISELQPGDLVFFNTMRRTFSHVGIYLGDNRFIHAPRTGERVRIDMLDNGYWEQRLTGARRMAATSLARTASARALPVSYTPDASSPGSSGKRVRFTMPGPTDATMP